MVWKAFRQKCEMYLLIHLKLWTSLMTDYGSISYLFTSQVTDRLAEWKLGNTSLGTALTYLNIEHLIGYTVALSVEWDQKAFSKGKTLTYFSHGFFSFLNVSHKKFYKYLWGKCIINILLGKELERLAIGEIGKHIPIQWIWGVTETSRVLLPKLLKWSQAS
jgi:hypothetical protein